MATRRTTRTKRGGGAKGGRARSAEGAGAGAKAPEGEPSGELLDMGQAIELLKTSRPTFYRWLRSGKVKGMKLGRQWRFYREDIERFLKGQEPRVDLPADLKPLIGSLTEKVEALEARDVSPPDADDVVRAVGLMIRLAVAMEASDLHIEPHFSEAPRSASAMVRVRVDGVLHPVAEFDIRLLPAIDERWKRMAACDVREKARPQDGRILIKLADCGKTVDLRVSFMFATLGPSLTARILDPDAVRPLDLDASGYAPRDQALLAKAVAAPWGLVVVSGPTGCGKTTTLYACLNRLAGPERKVMTVEDPVEILLPWVLQSQLRTHAGATFPIAVRSMLRSAANVMLVGEVRDRETAEMVCQAALTGHLVFTTLHTDESARVLTRLVEIGLDPFLVGDATRVVIAQRLIRKLCPVCSVPREPQPSRLEQAARLARTGGLDWDALDKHFCAPAGCPSCHQTGFRGREVVAEALEATPAIGEALRRGAPLDELRTLAVGQGMTTMAADAIRRAAAGVTSLDEALRVV